jgi:hypothetical protein
MRSRGCNSALTGRVGFATKRGVALLDLLLLDL